MMTFNNEKEIEAQDLSQANQLRKNNRKKTASVGTLKNHARSVATKYLILILFFGEEFPFETSEWTAMKKRGEFQRWCFKKDSMLQKSIER